MYTVRKNINLYIRHNIFLLNGFFDLAGLGIFIDFIHLMVQYIVVL